MQKNVSKVEALIRGIIGILLFGLAAAFNAHPFISLFLALIGLVLVGTALTHSCPLYSVLRTRTKPRKH